MCDRCSCKSPYEDTLNGQCFDPNNEADAEEFRELVELDRLWHLKHNPSRWTDEEWEHFDSPNEVYMRNIGG
jgi:hypothetical protein